VGSYEARVTPVADTDPSTELGAKVKLVAGTYHLIAQAPGYGVKRFTVVATAGGTVARTIVMSPNWASTTQGASATGPGTDPQNLIDDTEGTVWSDTEATNVNTAKPKVTIHLGGGAHTLARAQVSALIGTADSRFDALRQFRIQACDATAGLDCSLPAGWSTIYTSPSDAFPGGVPRPLAPNMILRAFSFSPTKATDVRLVVLNNQCTGGPAYQGDQDNDPLNNTDCTTGSSEGRTVDVAEFQVFSTG
jgi:extracellular elastinolytic metalloproteinase